MLSPHISSAFAQERQTRYRREAETRRLVGRRTRRGHGHGHGTARAPTTDAPAGAGTRAPTPRPAH